LVPAPRDRGPEHSLEEIRAGCVVEPLPGRPDAQRALEVADREQPRQVEQGADVIKGKVREDDVERGEVVDESAVGQQRRAPVPASIRRPCSQSRAKTDVVSRVSVGTQPPPPSSQALIHPTAAVELADGRPFL
jgi:hypothetical protein